MSYIKRKLESTVERYLSLFPAVAVTGPRQSGKSTMLRKKFGKEYRYVTFDDPMEIDFFESDPEGFIKKYNDKIIFDEIQKAPGLFDYLKIMIDNERSRYGRFILTGSSQFALLKNITESLAGRIGMLSLLPFQTLEIPENAQKEQMIKGSYPELVVRDYRGHREWYSSYIANYLERDVRTLYNIGNLRDFRRCITLLASETAQELNMSRLSGEIGVSVKTIQSWISILEASYIVFTVQPFYRNMGKRIVKRPKIYFYDTGIVCYLAGIRNTESLNGGFMAGPVFENYIVAEIKKAACHGNVDADIYYFRSNLGLEVDLIIDDRAGEKLDFIEIKNSGTAKQKMLEGLTKLIDLEKKSGADANKKINGLLVYRGIRRIFSPQIRAVKYIDFLREEF